jgi:hypothetical protein
MRQRSQLGELISAEGISTGSQAAALPTWNRNRMSGMSGRWDLGLIASLERDTVTSVA